MEAGKRQGAGSVEAEGGVKYTNEALQIAVQTARRRRHLQLQCASGGTAGGLWDDESQMSVNLPVLDSAAIDPLFAGNMDVNVGEESQPQAAAGRAAEAARACGPQLARVLEADARLAASSQHVEPARRGPQEPTIPDTLAPPCSEPSADHTEGTPAFATVAGIAGLLAALWEEAGGKHEGKEQDLEGSDARPRFCWWRWSRRSAGTSSSAPQSETDKHLEQGPAGPSLGSGLRSRRRSHKCSSFAEQLLEFRDDKTPLSAAIFSPNAIEIFFGRGVGQAYLVILWGICLAMSLQFSYHTVRWLVGHSPGPMTKDFSGVDYGVVVWSNVFVGIGFNAVSTFCLFRAGFEVAIPASCIWSTCLEAV